MSDPTTLLVVDDYPANLQLITALLPEYKCKVATGGLKALQIARAEPHPDLILLDVMMPEMDGYEVCLQLKCDPRTKTIPVIFLSGHTDEAGRQKGLRLGARDFISKPLDPEQVRKAVASALAPRF